MTARPRVSEVDCTSKPKSSQMIVALCALATGLADLPCGAFKKNPDGSWTQGATLIAGGALIVGLNFKNTNETRIIESKCDKK